MAIYVVMESGRADADAEGMPVAVYVRDGFSLFAFLIPVFWLLWRRLWIEAVLALAVTLSLGSFGAFAGQSPLAVTLLSLLIGAYVALEGPALRIAALRRRGWREWGVVKADSREDAETRYLYEASGEPAAVPRAGNAALRTGARPAMGLLDYPGGR